MGGMWTLFDQRMDTIETTQRLAEERSMAANGKISAILKDHETSEGHAGILAKYAEQAQKFTEVETQFRWKDELVKQAHEFLGRRLDTLEAQSKERGDRWIPVIVQLQERVKALEEKP